MVENVVESYQNYEIQSGYLLASNDEKESNLIDNSYMLYIYGMKSPITREKYGRRLKIFFDFIKFEYGKGKTIEERFNLFVEKAKENPKWLLENIFRFIIMLKQRNESKDISGATLQNYLKPIKLMCSVSDLDVPWKKITRGLPNGRRYANDRAPTIEEIRKLTEYPDRRIKPIIYTMASSGIRLGSWDFLRWGNIIPIEKDGELVAAKIIVYANEEDEYFSFVTKEAYLALKEWMNYRQTSGEIITKDSWVMRNLWDVTTPTGKGVVTIPKKLQSSGIKRLIERAYWAQGLRQKLEGNKRRHEFQTDHGFRKWFKTRCELSGMKSINIEVLMGHSIGLSDNYYRATEDELLKDYLIGTDFLTISGISKLEKEISELRKKNDNNEFLISSKLQDREDEIKKLKESDILKKDVLEHLSDQLIVLTNRIQELEKKNT